MSLRRSALLGSEDSNIDFQDAFLLRFHRIFSSVTHGIALLIITESP